MKLNKKLSKNFFISLFWKQNKWHKHGVLMHTIKVCYHTIRLKHYNFIIPALLHDVGKPFVAFQKEEDIINGEYSFTNHEEMSYQIIKKWSFISDRTKNLVRYHYIIRDIGNSQKKNDMLRNNRLLKKWDKFDEEFKEELRKFLKCDDLGKV
jgi:hypothetical protein